MSQTTQIASASAGFGGALASGNTQAAVGAGAAAAGATTLAILGPAAAAGPIGLAIGGAVLAIQMLSGKISHLINGCGQTCTYATQVVNEAEPLVAQIKDAYFQTPVRDCAFRDWTLQQIDSVFAQVSKLCSQPGLGDAGKNCISERFDRTSCKWHDDSGKCWNWVVGYRDPVANDPCVQATPIDQASVAVQQLAAGVPGGYGTLAVVGLAVFAFVAYRIRTA